MERGGGWEKIEENGGCYVMYLCGWGIVREVNLYGKVVGLWVEGGV